jgi:ATP-dependent helicase YprA (DUF1998 family)
MDNVFNFRDQLISEYSTFSRSFSKISAVDISAKVEQEYAEGRYWPEPLIQINPNYRRSATVQQLAAKGDLHAACAELFKAKKPEGTPVDLFLYAHQLEALAKASQNKSYVVTTGTGSGKSLSFFIPIVDRILKAKEQEKKQDANAKSRTRDLPPLSRTKSMELSPLILENGGYEDHTIYRRADHRIPQAS